MNERGSMLIDSLLSFLIVSICTLVLLPLYLYMQTNASKQLLEYRASEVLLNAAKEFTVEGNTKGTFTIEEQQFNWSFKEEQLCVFYMFRGEEAKRCVTSTSEDLP